ncbi:MAG: DNA polymerase IV [Nitrospinota bacterium]|nr:DNA polymerase IV [Nitrospinota bacterium]
MEPPQTRNKIIAHVDLDAFFVSVEELLNPSLRGKPVIVGGDPSGRGVVSAASYAARKFGVHSGMPSSQARRLCPRAIFLRGSHGIYSQYSHQVMEILGRFTPAVEQVSVDEAYLDLTGCQRLHKAGAVEIAQKIHHAIQAETGLPASIGVGAGRIVAKIAANSAKPNGMMVINPGREAAFLAPLPIGRMPGIGPVSQREYMKLGIRKIGDLSQFEPELLRQVLGNHGAAMARRAKGEDEGHVEFSAGAEGRSGLQSVSREVTYSTDTGDPERIRATVSYLSESVGRRVRRAGLVFDTVTLKLRRASFSTVTRSRALPKAGDDTSVIYRTACGMLEPLLAGSRERVRLVGVGVRAMEKRPEQMDLFLMQREARMEALHRSMDRARDKYGFESALMARSILHGRG